MSGRLSLHFACRCTEIRVPSYSGVYSVHRSFLIWQAFISLNLNLTLGNGQVRSDMYLPRVFWAAVQG
jgi:xanthine dehydrogenase molybdopterin-binding subunit B